MITFIKYTLKGWQKEDAERKKERMKKERKNGFQKEWNKRRMEDGMGERKKLLSVDRKEGNMKKPLIWLM